jgi:hypothetical protein
MNPRPCQLRQASTEMPLRAGGPRAIRPKISFKIAASRFRPICENRFDPFLKRRLLLWSRAADPCVSADCISVVFTS